MDVSEGEREVRLLRRYYLAEFLKLFGLTALGLSAILSLLELLKWVDDFAPHNPSVASVALYASLNVPRYFLYVMPAAALICSLYTISHAARSREIVAVMAAGGRIKRLLVPFVAAGFALSLAGFLLSEFVVPACSRAAIELRHSILKEQTLPSLLRDGMIWLRAKDGSIVKIDFYLEDRDAFRGMSIFRIENGDLAEIIHADEAAYSRKTNTWMLKGVRKYLTSSGTFEEDAEATYSGLGYPGVFTEGVQKPYEIGIVELARYIKRLRESGFRNQRLSVEMNSKISYPLVSLFMVLLGVSFSARRGIGGLAATAMGLLISLIYWFGYTMTLSLGYAGIFPPFVAVWIMPALFAGLGVRLFRKIPE
jgi:LPS export ABC transporter permease LptG